MKTISRPCLSVRIRDPGGHCSKGLHPLKGVANCAMRGDSGLDALAKPRIRNCANGEAMTPTPRDFPQKTSTACSHPGTIKAERKRNNTDLPLRRLAKNSLRFEGAEVRSDGQFHPQAGEGPRVHSGKLSVSVPAYSAALIRLG